MPSVSYVVHMKHVTTSEARKNWFKLLDEAAKDKSKIPDYGKIIQIPDAENADKWGWKWSERRGLVPITKPIKR